MGWNVRLIPLIGIVWWSLFATNSLSRKALVNGGNESTTLEGVTTEFSKLHWIDLTVVQLITAALVSTCMAKYMGKSTCVFNLEGDVFIAALCHLVATLATNAAFTVIDSDIANLLGTCQPIFTFLLVALNASRFDLSLFLSVIIIVVGAFMFQINSASLLFNFWGLLVALTSSVAFSKRDVVVKQGNSDGLEKFVAILSWSVILISPVWLLKVAVTGTVFSGHNLILNICYTTYSLVSFLLLEMMMPVTYALMVTCIKLFSTKEGLLITFQRISISSNTVFSLFVISLGLFLYVIRNYYNRHRQATLLLKLLSLLIIVSSFILLNPKYPLWSSDKARHNTKYNVDFLRMSRPASSDDGISTAWLYDRDIPVNVVLNIGYIADSNPCRKVYVYCGTTQCIHEVASLEKENIVVGFAVISDIVKGTPLERWVADHPIHKLLAGPKFEKHVHEVAIIGILWEYGGFWVNPLVKLANGHLPHYESTTTSAFISPEWNVSNTWNSSLLSLFHVSYFSRHHPVIKTLAEIYSAEYSEYSQHTLDLSTVWKTAEFEEMVLVQSFEIANLLDSESKTHHYGVLSPIPDLLPQKYHFGNEIENFAALQFLPFADCILAMDMKNLTFLSTCDNFTAFINGGWRTSDRASLQLVQNHLNPVMLSVGIKSVTGSNLSEHMQSSEANAFDHLQDGDVIQGSSFGSLILLMKNPNPSSQERSRIFIVDVRQEYLSLLPSEIEGEIVRSTPTSNSSVPTSKIVHQIFKELASAKLVVTSNIAYALCCVALDTPVIYVHDKNSTNTFNSLFHFVNVSSETREQAMEWFWKFPWANVPHNPNPGTFMRLRATSWNVVRRNRHLHGTAVRFGVVPMTPPLSLRHNSKLVFYLIFTTSEENSINMFKSSSTVSGKFNWRHWRSIESIFYHHPTAEVKVFSNTLPEHTFNVLIEAGYSIRVCRYHLEDLLKNTPAETFIKKLRKASRSAFWYTHQADLLRFTVLYKWGGIYMDTDIIIVRPLDSLKANTLGWESKANSGGLVNGAFAKFDQGNPFLEACLKDFAINYRSDIWGYNCPMLLTRVYNNFEWSNDVVTVVDYKKFYMISGSDMNQQCFSDTEGSRFEHNVRLLKEEAVVVHTNTKISGSLGINRGTLKNGTICKHLLNSYCVLCNEIH